MTVPEPFSQLVHGQPASDTFSPMDRLSAMTMILHVLCDSTGMGFAAVARVTETSWTACAVLDRIGFGIKVGGQLDVATTFCKEIRDCKVPILIEKASTDEVYGSHPTPRLYGFESYIAVPVLRRDGTCFGTVCALDPQPMKMERAKLLPTLRLFAELIATQIELEEYLDALRESEQRLQFALEMGRLGAWEFHPASRRFWASDICVQNFGLRDGADLSDYDALVESIHPEDRQLQAQEVARALTNHSQLDLEYRHVWPNGSTHWVRVTGRGIYQADGAPVRMIGLALDVTEKRAAEAALFHLAHHDVLTDLANRRLLDVRVAEAISTVNSRSKVALLCVDLDHFKTINDALGHEAGDSLLRHAAAMLSGCVRECDTVARHGGDEFAVLLTGVEDRGYVERFASRASLALSVPYNLDGRTIILSGSIGISLSPDDATEPRHLWRNADTALYRVKATGRGHFRFFEAVVDTSLQAREALKLSLPIALEKGELKLFYQPLFELASKRCVEFEALLRWQHPVHGLISPTEFIPIAEETGWIVQFGRWALNEACREATTWPERIGVSVNLSVVQFSVGDLVTDVANALANTGLAPGRLELEVTETLLLQSTQANTKTLETLRRMGVRIALDDFGTGYSSLSYLRQFAFDKIKIDKSLVSGLPDADGGDTIVRAIVGLGKSLDILTAAEGVETLVQLALLQELGCTQAQGFLFSRPVPAADVSALIDQAWPT